jgi:hypothetical protein
MVFVNTYPHQLNWGLILPVCLISLVQNGPGHSTFVARSCLKTPAHKRPLRKRSIARNKRDDIQVLQNFRIPVNVKCATRIGGSLWALCVTIQMPFDARQV